MSEETNNYRWDAFSDEELERLHLGLLEAENEDPHPGSDSLRAELTKELMSETARRDTRTTYHGPGRYRHLNEKVYEVLGTVGDPDVMADRTQAVVRDKGGFFMLEPLANFARSWTYLGPLENTPASVYATAPTDVKLVDAGQGWALIETWDGHRHRLNTGDIVVVPTAVIS